MALQRPPDQLARVVEGVVPGAYASFYNAVVFGNMGTSPRLTSWWRSIEHNAEVGGQRLSQHLLGLAVDLVYPDVNQKSWAIDQMRRLGLVVLDEGDHVHAQLFRAGEAERFGVFAALGYA